MGEGHFIKGAAFVTLSRWFAERGGEAAHGRMLEALTAEDREILSSVATSAWYPEELNQRVLGALFQTTAERDTDRFEAIIDECTLLGVMSFARIVMSMSSPAFVLRRAPGLWSVLRRGPASLEVTQTADGSRLAYRSFPYFADPLYRHYFRGLLTSLVRPASKGTPVVRIAGFTGDSLDVDVEHR